MVTQAVAELKQIPFGVLIGSPLRATVQAQALAAKTTIEFIEKVGFLQNDPNQPDMLANEGADAEPERVRYVKFSYSKTDEKGESRDFSLTVPVLSIVPIPCLRVEEVTIDFTATLSDVVQTSRSDKTNVSASVKASWDAWWSPVSVDMRASYSHEAQRTQTSRYSREYRINVHVRAVQDDMPAGLAKVLQILEQSIKEAPKAP